MNIEKYIMTPGRAEIKGLRFMMGVVIFFMIAIYIPFSESGGYRSLFYYIEGILLLLLLILIGLIFFEKKEIITYDGDNYRLKGAFGEKKIFKVSDIVLIEINPYNLTKIYGKDGSVILKYQHNNKEVDAFEDALIEGNPKIYKAIIAVVNGRKQTVLYNDGKMSQIPTYSEYKRYKSNIL